MRHILSNSIYYTCCLGLTIFYFSVVSSVQAQDSRIRLFEALEQAKEDAQDSLYYELFRNTLYSNGDLNEARAFALSAHHLSAKYNHSFLFTKTCRALGMLNHRLELYDSARYYYYKGIYSSQKFGYKELLVYTTNDLGLHFENHDMYDSALKYYHSSLENAIKLEMEEDMAFTLNNIGLVFYYLNNYNEAMDNLQRSIEIKRRLNISSLHISLMNIALIYNDQARFDEALQLLNEVESNYASQCNDFQLADLNFSLGYAHYHKGNPDKALQYFGKAYEFARSSNNRKAIANSLHYFGIHSLSKDDFVKSQEYLEAALAIAEELNLRRVKRDIYKELQHLYKKKGDLENVVVYQTKYMMIKDSIFNEQLASNLKEIQLNAQKKQSEAIIQQKDSEIQKVRLITGLVGIITALVIIVSVLIYRNYRISHRMRRILEKEIKKQTSELVKSNADLIQMTQEYDQLVYRASHDIRGPLATLMGLTNIAKQDYEEPLRVKDYLDKIGSTAMGLNQTLSQLMETNHIRNLPICIEEVEVGSMVEEVYSSFKSLNHFPLISLRIERGDWSGPLMSDKHLISFILTKLIDNAFRYFASFKTEKYIKISWSQSEDKTIIAVEDNGLGIDTKAKEKIFQLFYVASDIHGSGLGLFLAQMAANRLGGRIILARSSEPTIFKLIISTNLVKAQLEDKPFMTVAS